MRPHGFDNSVVFCLENTRKQAMVNFRLTVTTKLLLHNTTHDEIHVRALILRSFRVGAFKPNLGLPQLPSLRRYLSEAHLLAIAPGLPRADGEGITLAACTPDNHSDVTGVGGGAVAKYAALWAPLSLQVAY